MLGQVFRGGSLRAAVREIQASVCAADGERDLSNSTGSYSDARQRLPQHSVDAVHRRVCEKMMSAGGFAGGRRVMVVDGTSVQLEDTAANQEEYPQPAGQEPGCGFPVMQIVALFNLDSAALEHFSFSPHTADEGSMFDVELMEHLQAGDVLLGDRLYGSYLHFAALPARGVDVLTRLHGSRGWPKGMRGDDGTVQWRRPAPSARPPHVTQEEWEALPATITVRYVRYGIDIAGFRTRHIMVATTLLEAPAKELAQLYLRRWDIELCCDDIKTTMAMDFIPRQVSGHGGENAHPVCHRLQLGAPVDATSRAHHRLSYRAGELDAPVLQGRAGCYLALRCRNGTGSPASDGAACEKNCSEPSPPTPYAGEANASNPESLSDDQNPSR